MLQPYDNEVGAGTFHTATTVSYTHLLWMCIDVVVVSLCAVLASLGAYGFVEGTLDSTVPR